MTQYLADERFTHGQADRIGVLIANLGTPDAPTTGPVRRFLAEFLSDPRVVDAPRWYWLPALHGVVLRIRPAKSAHAYQQIWTPQGSPLMVHSRALAQAIHGELADENYTLALGMTYGSPSLADALAQLRDAGAHRIVVLPLYPQYSCSTSASVFDRVTAELRGWRWVPELRFVMSYHDDPAYIDAIAESIRRHGVEGHLLLSFHGVPKRFLLAGDPYHCQCQKTARLIAARLGLRDEQWSISFQSQVGREEWLKPYTDAWLLEHARNGGKRVTLVCPGFATDCLETLEENAMRNRAAFLEAGGEHFAYVPALNAAPAHVALLADLVRRHASGWAAPATESAREESRARALQLGAAC